MKQLPIGVRVERRGESRVGRATAEARCGECRKQIHRGELIAMTPSGLAHFGCELRRQRERRTSR